MTRIVVLFGHGSRDPAWRAPMDAVAHRLHAQGVRAECAFLELQRPTLAEAVDAAVASGARAVTVLPMFLGVGKHAREDLPALVAALRSAHPSLEIDLRPSVGEDPRVLDVLAQLALSPAGPENPS